MSKVHIALVGGQPAPVYYGVFQIDPDRVVLIASQDTSIEAERIKVLLQRNNFSVEVIQLDPTNLNEIYACCEKLIDTYKEDIISLNLIGGTKHWALAFFDSFSKTSNCSIYLLDQNNRMWDLRSKDFEDFYSEVDIDEYLELYGNPSYTYTPFSKYDESDFDAIKDIEAIWIKNKYAFTQIASLLDEKNSECWKEALENNKHGLFELSNNQIYWKKPNYVKIVLYDRFGKKHECEITSPNAVKLTFNTHWFELKVARILSKWPKAKDIRLNCVFPLNKNSDKEAKNEIDIIINAGSKLVFVECKTSIYNGTDIDKFRTVVKNYGGNGTKNIVVTQSPLGKLPLKKCDESNIMHFSLKGNNPELLLNLLDKHLPTINK